MTKKSSTCIDLIFTKSPNLISNTGVELSLFDKSHYSLLYGVIDFKVRLPPPYLREVWDYKNTSAVPKLTGSPCFEEPMLTKRLIY